MANFQLIADNRAIAGSHFSLPIKVQPGAVDKPKSAVSDNAIILSQRPMIRVGLTRVKPRFNYKPIMIMRFGKVKLDY